METGFLQYTMELLKKDYKTELDMLDITLPKVDEIPQVRFDEAKVLWQKYNRQIRKTHMILNQREPLIGRYFEEEYGRRLRICYSLSEQVKVVQSGCNDDPDDKTFTQSFDLV